MPIYDITCPACGHRGEVIVPAAMDNPACPVCGAAAVKALSPSSSLTGRQRQAYPGTGDTGCCGGSPATAGCAGPGTCCGKTP